MHLFTIELATRLKRHLYVSAVIPQNKTTPEILGIADCTFPIWLDWCLGVQDLHYSLPLFADAVPAGLTLLNHAFSFEGTIETHTHMHTS